MQEYVVGDEVRVNNPDHESLSWLGWAPEMNVYDDRETVVNGIRESASGRKMYSLKGCGTWKFAAEWLEPLGQLPGQMSIEDFGLVVDS